MESTRRQAQTENTLYRMESITPDLMQKLEDDGDLDAMMSDDDDQINSSSSNVRSSSTK